MNVHFRDAGEAESIIALIGDLDVYTSPLVKRRLLALFKRGRTQVVLNLDEVRYIDSTGVGVLLDALRCARALNGSISIVVSAERTRRLFENLGLRKAFTIFDDDQQALRRMPRAPNRSEAFAR